MKMDFTEDLEKINEEAAATTEEVSVINEEAAEDGAETAQEAHTEAEEAEEAVQTALTDLTNFTMTVDQSIFAIVEPGSAPLLRSSTTYERAKLFNALNGSSESVKDWLGEEVDITDIVITSADVPSIMGDEDSERVCKPCVHFFTLDGSHISSISNGIIKATKMLLACMTPSEEDPIRIRFKEISTKKGTAHSFDMV